MEEIKFCPHCGHGNKGTSNFCEKCGASLNNEVQNPNNSVPFSSAVPNQATETFNETPIVEKNTITLLNYSQTLRRNLFINPWPLISGSIFLVFVVASFLITYLLDSTIDTYFFLNFVFIGLDLFYLFYYLILSPLKTISASKRYNVENYRISFYSDRLRYQLSMNIQGQEIRNDFFMLYKDIFKVKEYKDMLILGFGVQGQIVPLCLLKDEIYDKIIPLLQDKINQLRGK